MIGLGFSLGFRVEFIIYMRDNAGNYYSGPYTEPSNGHAHLSGSTTAWHCFAVDFTSGLGVVGFGVERFWWLHGFMGINGSGLGYPAVQGTIRLRLVKGT